MAGIIMKRLSRRHGGPEQRDEALINRNLLMTLLRLSHSGSSSPVVVQPLYLLRRSDPTAQGFSRRNFFGDLMAQERMFLDGNAVDHAQLAHLVDLLPANLSPVECLSS
jgi:hypothetical protein